MERKRESTIEDILDIVDDFCSGKHVRLESYDDFLVMFDSDKIQSNKVDEETIVLFPKRYSDEVHVFLLDDRPRTEAERQLMMQHEEKLTHNIKKRKEEEDAVFNKILTYFLERVSMAHERIHNRRCIHCNKYKKSLDKKGYKTDESNRIIMECGYSISLMSVLILFMEELKKMHLNLGDGQQIEPRIFSIFDTFITLLTDLKKQVER